MYPLIRPEIKVEWLIHIKTINIRALIIKSLTQLIDWCNFIQDNNYHHSFFLPPPCFYGDLFLFPRIYSFFFFKFDYIFFSFYSLEPYALITFTTFSEDFEELEFDVLDWLLFT